MKKGAEERNLNLLAKVHDSSEMWQGSQNIRANEKESHAQSKQMATIGYIWDTVEIVRASWSLIQHDGAAAFKFSERSHLPSRLSAKDVPGGRTQILNVHQIRTINHHPVKSDQDSAPESIWDTEDWLNCNGNLDNPNDPKDDCTADVESYIEEGSSINDPECKLPPDVSTAPNVPRLIWPTLKSKRQAEMVLVRVNGIKTRSNKLVKKT